MRHPLSKRPRTSPGRVGRRLLATTVGAGVALSVAAAAGSGGVAGAASSAPSTPSPAAFGGASGTLAAINGQSLEVQSASSQTTVNYTATTMFTQTSSATLADVAVGTCVSAFGAPVKPAATSKGATPAKTKASTGPKKTEKSAGAKKTGTSKATTKSTNSTKSTKPPAAASGPVKATTVRISQPVSGACSGGPGGGAGFGGVRPPAGGSVPAGRRPSGRGFARGAGLGGANGLVTAVNGSTITVQQTNPTTKATTTRTVNVTASTTYTQVASATSAALTVGQCVVARGPADSTGAVTASTIGLSAAGANGCSTGFAGRPGGPGGGPGAYGGAGA